MELLPCNVDSPNECEAVRQIKSQPQHEKYQPQFEIATFIDTVIQQNQHQYLPEQQQSLTPTPQNILDSLCQSHINSISPNHFPISPSAQFVNICNNHQYQLNIPNTSLVNAVINFMGNNSNQTEQNPACRENKLEENSMNYLNLDHAHQVVIDNNNDDVILESFSSMSISSGPILDSQFAVEMCRDFIKHLDNNGGEVIQSC